MHKLRTQKRRGLNSEPEDPRGTNETAGIEEILKINFLKSSPPRPLASRHVDALTQHPNLEDLKQAHKGEVYPPPSPSLPVRLAGLQPGLDYSWLL